jgi:hypothetical protein
MDFEDCDDPEQDAAEDPEDAGGVRGQEQDAGKRPPDSALLPWPWASSELMMREAINMYRGSGKSSVVDFCPGLGAAALAATRDNITYSCFTLNEKHTQVMWQAMLLIATVEVFRCVPGALCPERVPRDRFLAGAHEDQPDGAACPVGLLLDAD